MADRSGGRKLSEEDMRLLSQQATGSSGGRPVSQEDLGMLAVSDADVVEAMGILNSGRAESDEDRAMSQKVLRKATASQSRMARKELGIQPKKSGGG